MPLVFPGLMLCSGLVAVRHAHSFFLFLLVRHTHPEIRCIDEREDQGEVLIPSCRGAQNQVVAVKYFLVTLEVNDV